MGLNDSLKNTSLTELFKMFSEASERLAEAKMSNDMESVETHQNTLDQIQEALIIKRAENPPLK